MNQSDIGLIGLGVMGANLARNIASKEWNIIVFNRSEEKTKQFLEKFGNKNITGEIQLETFVQKLKKPRKILLMVKAGEGVDEMIQKITPFLEKGDIICDLGNSHYKDTTKRARNLQEKEIYFIGCGISGGAEGALKGPSLMLGGNKKACQTLLPFFRIIAAKDFEGNPCATYIGPAGSGHFVKMVHNGIEYGLMQILAEIYDIFRSVFGMSAPEISKIFEKWGKTRQSSYLLTIAAEILKKKDPLKEPSAKLSFCYNAHTLATDGSSLLNVSSSDTPSSRVRHPRSKCAHFATKLSFAEGSKKGLLIDAIFDKASQKGTGGWTVMDSAEKGVPIPTITAALDARYISAEKNLRVTLAKKFLKKNKKTVITEKIIRELESALFGANFLTYMQGYTLISTASEQSKWNIHLAEVTRIWQGGCIIRAKLLEIFYEALKKNPKKNPLELSEIQRELVISMPNVKKIVEKGVQYEVPTPALSASFQYFLSMTREKLPANFIQALRDCFGAHTYERMDRKGTFHTRW